VAELVRPPDEDLFRASPLLSISERRTIRSFGEGEVPREVVEEAVRAACTAPAPHHTRPWSFTALWSPAAKRRLLGAIAQAWRADLTRRRNPRGDDRSTDRAQRRRAGCRPGADRPWVRFERAHPYPDAERAHAEQEMFLLSGGAAIQNLLLALHAQGYASCWISSTLFCQQESREALGMGRSGSRLAPSPPARCRRGPRLRDPRSTCPRSSAPNERPATPPRG
jgi:coenzyme F420-0:L-glutamate ligase/coenzyme F420-1:gamma-L-glutamate ligase